MAANMTPNFKRWVLRARLACYMVIPIVLLILPSDFFDEGQSICLSVLLLNQTCYACGLTRAIMHLIHFEFVDAWYFNPLGFIVFPALAWQWLQWFLKDFKALKTLSASNG